MPLGSVTDLRSLFNPRTRTGRSDPLVKPVSAEVFISLSHFDINLDYIEIGTIQHNFKLIRLRRDETS